MFYKTIHFVLCLVIPVLSSKPGLNFVWIDTGSPVKIVSDKFLSVTIDSAEIQLNWYTLNFSLPKVQNLAKALSPCYIRVGGTAADFLQFSLNTSEYVDPKNNHVNYIKPSYAISQLENFTMTAKQWDELNTFVDKVGWDMIFDLNSLLRQNGQWLPDNAKLLMDYTSQKGYKIAGWELGNEPDVYYVLGFTINGTQRAKDYVTLSKLLYQYPQWRNSIVLGPSVTMLVKEISRKYLQDFLMAGGEFVVTNTCFHHYYVDGRYTSFAQFTSPKILDTLIQQIIAALNIGPSPPYGKLWLGETSSAYGGGAVGLSDRYVAGFMWLDKLGLSAVLGVDVVVRQTFYAHGGLYALIDEYTLDPNPDYWLSYLYKILVGRSVLNVTMTDKSGYVRMYAHCSNTKRSHYKSGSITVFGLNLKQEPSTILFPQYEQDIELHLYLLEPVGKDSLKSKKVALNGRTLELNEDFTLPNMMTPEIVIGSFTLPQMSFGFIVIPNANATVCQTSS